MEVPYPNIEGNGKRSTTVVRKPSVLDICKIFKILVYGIMFNFDRITYLRMWPKRKNNSEIEHKCNASILKSGVWYLGFNPPDGLKIR